LFFIWPLFGRCYTQPMKILKFRFLKTLFVISIFSFASLDFAGVYNSTTPPILPPEQMSIVGVSMGNAIVGDGTLFNATAFNPALLGQAPDTVELFQPIASVSNDDFGVYNYVQNGFNFDPSGTFQNLALDYFSPSSANNAAVSTSLSSFDSVVNNLTNKALEVGAGDNFAVKVTPNFGIEVFDTAHVLAEMIPGPLVQQLISININPYGGPSALGGAVTVMQNTIQTAINTIIPVSDQTGAVKNDITQFKQGGESPSAFANQVGSDLAAQGVTLNSGTLQNLQNQIINGISSDLAYLNALAYEDLIGMATIDFNPFEDFPLTIGINGKVVARSFSWASLTVSTSSTNQLTSFENDLKQYTTRWGIDVGALYAFEPNLTLGLSFEDLIKQSATIPNASIAGDILYGIITDPAPTVTRIGLSWHPIHEISLNSDIDDVFSTTSYYTGYDYFSHFKFGAALTLAGILQLRGGYSDYNFSGGVGIQLGFIGLDYSYAMDDLSYTYNHYAQLKIVF